MTDEKELVLKLTEQQRQQIREATGQDAEAIRLQLDELRSEIALSRYRPC